MPTVRVLRPFANEHPDRIVSPGHMIVVDVERARALAENGLVEPVVAVERAAPEPTNKMAPVPSNKALVSAVRRGRPMGSKSGVRGR